MTPTHATMTKPPKQRTSWYAVERYCPNCQEYWPADTEFFHPRPNGNLDSWCRACSNEHKRQRAARKRAQVVLQ